MSPGFIYAPQMAPTYQARWIPGPAIPIGFLGMLKLAMSRLYKRSVPIQTFRCDSCGYLESYALPDPPAPAVSSRRG
jgi:hypothetical protein